MIQNNVDFCYSFYIIQNTTNKITQASIGICLVYSYKISVKYNLTLTNYEQLKSYTKRYPAHVK